MRNCICLGIFLCGACVSRFGRLQDTLADKLFEALLDAMAKTLSAATENIERAEKIGRVTSAQFAIYSATVHRKCRQR